MCLYLPGLGLQFEMMATLKIIEIITFTFVLLSKGLKCCNSHFEFILQNHWNWAIIVASITNCVSELFFFLFFTRHAIACHFYGVWFKCTFYSTGRKVCGYSTITDHRRAAPPPPRPTLEGCVVLQLVNQVEQKGISVTLRRSWQIYPTKDTSVVWSWNWWG